MKVICVDNKVGNSTKANLNGIYDACEAEYTTVGKKKIAGDYYVINITGIDYWMHKRCFVSIEQHRNKKINEILNEF